MENGGILFARGARGVAEEADLIGEAHVAPGARGIQQIQDKIRETLTALRA